jgi:hypothetical protein
MIKAKKGGDKVASQKQKKRFFKVFEKSNSVLLNLQQRTKEDLPVGVWFTKGYSTKNEDYYIRAQITYLEKTTKADPEYPDRPIKRTWIDPPTFCSVDALEAFIKALINMSASTRTPKQITTE